MKTIAWTRLLFFIGASILLIAQIYLFLVEVLTFVVIAPALISILQYLVQFSLFLGFATLAFSYFRLYESFPPLLKPEDYSPSVIKNLMKLSVIQSFVLFILLLIPPTPALSEEVRLIFSEVVVILWTAYYGLILLWVINQWLLSNKKKWNHLKSIFSDYLVISHVVFTSILVILWFAEGFMLFVFQINLFDIQIFNIGYIATLLVFSIHQIVFLFKTTRFSYIIIG
ncbi:MAG: hypothetical protein ACTSPG_06330 [Candidatus Hodarchaeales archaeon]